MSHPSSAPVLWSEHPPTDPRRWFKLLEAWYGQGVMRRVHDERAAAWHRQMREATADRTATGRPSFDGRAGAWASVVDGLSAEGSEIDAEGRYALMRLTLDAQLPVAAATWWRLLPHVERSGPGGPHAGQDREAPAPASEAPGVTLDGYQLDPRAVQWLMHSAWPRHFYDNVERWWQHPTMPDSWRLLAIERHWLQRRRAEETSAVKPRPQIGGIVEWGSVQDEVRGMLDAVTRTPTSPWRDEADETEDRDTDAARAAAPPLGSHGEDWGNPPVWALVQLMRDHTRRSPDAMWRWALGLRQILHASSFVSVGRPPILQPLWSPDLSLGTWAMAVHLLTTPGPLTLDDIRRFGGTAPAGETGYASSAAEEPHPAAEALGGFEPDGVYLTPSLPDAMSTYSAEQWARVLPSLDTCQRGAAPPLGQIAPSSTTTPGGDLRALRAVLRPLLLSPWPGLRLWALQQVGRIEQLVERGPTADRWPFEHDPEEPPRQAPPSHSSGARGAVV